jgi:DNA polymerase IV
VSGGGPKSAIAAVPYQAFQYIRPYFYGIARGIDERRMRPDRVRKSVGAEETFAISTILSVQSIN